MNKTVIIGIIAILVVFSVLIVSSYKNKESRSVMPETPSQQKFSSSDQAQPVDKQASFAIYTNGTFRIFTASMYHNLSKDVFIKADNPNIVHVKKDKVTWDDFFKTLPFTLTEDCLTTGTKETFCTDSRKTLKFYLNGEINGKVLEQEIKDGDKLLVTYGSESEDIIKKQIDKIPQ